MKIHIISYYPIRCATSRHRASSRLCYPSLPGNLTSKRLRKQGGMPALFFFRPVVPLCVRYPKQQNSRPISVTFGRQNHQFGVAFGAIWRPLGTLLGLRGLPGSDSATEANFDPFPGESLTPLGIHSAPKSNYAISWILDDLQYSA